jgi:hypothetical protein|tara:strand:- start:1265 stop:1462 length:198 start_codon:yes stop_codon:yes gene_type:complete
MAKLTHDNALYYMRRAKVLLDHVEEENGEHDHILPQGGNKELVEIIKDLLFLIDRTGDFEEYDLG